VTVTVTGVSVSAIFAVAVPPVAIFSKLPPVPPVTVAVRELASL